MRRVSIFGATGSVGQNTLDLIRRDAGNFQVRVLTGGKNITQLAKDARELNAELAVTSEPSLLGELREQLSGSGVAVSAGAGALIEAADRPADWIMSAIVGAAGLEPGLRALRHGSTLALANKESLVAAGPLLLETAQQNGAKVLPVDSEHSAIFQALSGEKIETVEKIIITASGGAFRDWPIEHLKTASVSDASTHPNWDMGQRITIDSASMFNKALEVIETKEYFGVSPEQIQVLVHPQSLVHAMVCYRDGGIMAHLGSHDMRHAIGYALNWPHRKSLPVSRLNLAQIGKLEFRDPDQKRYPALGLAQRVMKEGGLSGAIFNAAKERTLDRFIAGEIGFTDMADIVARVLDAMLPDNNVTHCSMTIENIRDVDHLARVRTDELIRTTTTQKAG